MIGIASRHHGGWSRAWAVVATLLAAAGAARGQAPAGAAGVPAVRLVSAGGRHTCAIDTGGRTLCWGANDAGQAGAPPRASERAPVVVAVPPLVALAAGRRHTCGLDASGAAWCWGANGFGQLGSRPSATAHRPRRVEAGVAFTAITAGGDHTCALGVDRLAYCWGDQWDRAVGAFDAGDNVREPSPVRGGARFVAVSAGAGHTCGLTVEREVRCWGANDAGQSVERMRGRLVSHPVAVGLALPADSVAAGARYSCALRAGAIACWGAVPGPAGAAQQASAPPAPRAPFAAPADVRAVSLGGAFACAVSVRGGLACWSADGPTLPTPPDAGGVLQVSVGGAHACAVRLGGALVCWGADDAGQLGPGRR